MAKTLIEAKITTREQRKKLPAGIHWRGIDPDVHLGYRKGKRGGKWLVRWYRGPGQGYEQETFATADDEIREGTLDYGAAVKQARQLVEAARRTARAAAEGPLLTVRHAVEAHMAVRDARDSRRRGREVRSDATSRLSRYVTGRSGRGKRKAIEAASLAEVPLHDMTESDLLKWRAELPDRLKGTTKKRLFNDLRAALNDAYNDNRSKLPSTVPATVKHGLRAMNGVEEAEPVARENQILSDAQVMRLVDVALEIDCEQGWDGDLHRIVMMLAATGARFGQLLKLHVANVQVTERRIIMLPSLKGQGGNKIPTRLAVAADVIEALLPVLDRPADAPLLERWRSKQVPGSIRWERTRRGPWRTASELTRPWKAIRERAGMPEVIPYALRHSSIVRRLRLGENPALVAKLHDTSIPMIERHYGRYLADALDDLAAKNVLSFGPESRGENVVQLAAAVKN